MTEILGSKGKASTGTAIGPTREAAAALSEEITEIDISSLPLPRSGTDESDVNVKTNPRDINSNPTVDYVPNILDDYDAVTYHFRLFMMSPDGIRRRTFDSKGQAERILIAESGATTIGIDDVSITSYPSPSSRNRMGTATGVRFTLTQPLGADLVDKIFAGSKKLGLQQFAKTPFFLELSFRSRDPDRTLGGAVPGFLQEASLGDDELSNVIWVWPIILKTMNMTVDSGGSMYTITAVAESDLPYSNHISDIEKKVTVTTSTVEDAVKDLESQLQAKEKLKVETNKTQAVEDTYKFYIDVNMAESKIITNKETRNAEFDKENPEKVMLTYEPGTSVERILEDVLSNSVYLQTKARGVDNKDAPTDDKSKADATEQVLYRVYTDTQLGEFDKIRNDYARNHRFAIVPYTMTTINTRANRGANVSSQQRFDNIRDTGKLRKAYNYIYTGLNDQVFDFDISLNFSWYAIDKFMGGRDINAINEPADKTADVKKPDTEGRTATDPQSLSERLGLDPDSPLGEFVEDTSRFIQSDAAVGGLAEGIATGDFDQLTGQSQEFLASQISKGVRVAGNKINPKKFTQETLQEREQLIEEQMADENATNALAANETYLESSNATSQSISGGDIESPGKTLLAQFFEQAAGPPSKDLLNISVRVKGDPFWLSPGPVGRNAQFKTIFDEALASYGVAVNPQDPNGGIQTYQADNLSSLSSVEPALSQQYFLFRTFTPLEGNGETGITEGFSDNNVINGVFAARIVEHSFSAGQFTQTIDGWRDTRIDLKNINLGIGSADTRGFIEQFASNSDPFKTGIESLDTSFATIAEGGVDLSQNPLEEYTGLGPRSPTNTGPVDFQGRPIVGDDDG